jgi:dTDP-4-amino-4,6-dideoxygalactose transaminase
MIPYNDISRIHEPLKAEFKNTFNEVMENNTFIGGEAITAFENALKDKFVTSNVVACANGTDAIQGALRCLDLSPEDEVIVPAMTWISTAEVVNLVGATPIFCDINPDTFVMEAEDIEAVITEKTKCIIVVHLYGNMPEMSKIDAIVKKYGLSMIEDCAQAHLSSFNQTSAGSFGDFATFSFFPGKNLGAFGDAGAISAKKPEDENFLRKFFNHGAIKRHQHDIIGTNSRLDTLQAKILSIKLRYIEDWTLERIEIAKIYDEMFQSSLNIKTQKVHKKVVNSRHIYPVLVDKREEFLSYLKSNGIGYNINYPVPLHLQKCFKTSTKISLKNSEYLGKSQVSLPIFPGMRTDEVLKVSQTVLKYYD